MKDRNLAPMEKLVDSFEVLQNIYLAMWEVTEAAAWLREAGRDDEMAWSALLESLGRNEVALPENFDMLDIG